MEGEREERVHRPVLLKEVISALNVKRGKKYIDATVGSGGHTWEILKRGGRVLGIDCDPEAIRILKTENRKQKTENRKLIFVQGNFKDLKKIAKTHRFNKVAGILFDLGLSSWQIEESGRGFSYLRNEPLDMRMDPALKVTAAEIVNSLTKEELYEIFAQFGEEVNSWAIANAIVRARPLKTTKELAGVVGNDASRLARVFQALRIVVNNVIENLKKALPQAIELLEKGGRLVIISFHSLEDRLVKFGFKNKNLKIITKKPIKPSKEEIIVNPRARSAKLRIAERI